MVGVFAQLWALIVRQAQIIKGNTQLLGSTFMSAAMLALIFGAVFYKMDLSADGGFTRGGALFSSVLFNGMVPRISSS